MPHCDCLSAQSSRGSWLPRNTFGSGAGVRPSRPELRLRSQAFTASRGNRSLPMALEHGTSPEAAKS